MKNDRDIKTCVKQYGLGYFRALCPRANAQVLSRRGSRTAASVNGLREVIVGRLNMDEKIKTCLKRYWGFDSLRPLHLRQCAGTVTARLKDSLVSERPSGAMTGLDI